MTTATRVRACTWFLIVGLSISGLTAIPIQAEVDVGRRLLGEDWRGGGWVPAFASEWLGRLDSGIARAAEQAPFMFYGTDWLAFGHLMIALAFVGALPDPVRNRWLYLFGMIASVLVPIWAAIFGQMRGIPIWWRLLDASFGLVAFIPSWMCWRWTSELEGVALRGPMRDRR